MQKLQDSVFSILKTTNLSSSVFNFLQPSEVFKDETPLGGVLSNTRLGWLALGPKFCVVDLKTGLKVAAHTFGASLSNSSAIVTSVVELPTPLTHNSKQLIISLECENIGGMICVFHINGSQMLRCIQTEAVLTTLAVCDGIPNGPFMCFDGVIMAGTKSGEILVFDLNRASLIQSLKDISQGYEYTVHSENSASELTFLSFEDIYKIDKQRDVALNNDDHIAVILNEKSFVEGQYIFHNPDGTIRLKAKRDHIKVSALKYIPQLASIAVGFNFGAFQIWNLTNLKLEFTSQVNVECLPITNFGFQEPCDDPRAFCYLWVVFSLANRFEDEDFPLAVMYSLTYQGKRMLSDVSCLYEEFHSAALRFQLELTAVEDSANMVGARCISCNTYSVSSTLAEEGEDNMLNICHIVWECWGQNATSVSQYGMILFDLDQWYKDQMPATYSLESNAFMSVTWCPELVQGSFQTLDVQLDPFSVSPYTHATRLEEHFYPNSLQYDIICLNTSEVCILNTIGIQRQIISSMDEVGPTSLLNPTRLYNACVGAGLTPLYYDSFLRSSQTEQREYLLCVALEARLSRFLRRAAHDWATGSHAGVDCTLSFMVDWAWKRAIELKENAKELTAPLFASAALPDRNVTRCLGHCVQQLSQLTNLLDDVLTKCCNLVLPDVLNEIEEKYKGVGTVSLYFQVVQWLLRVGLLPERHDSRDALPYPFKQLTTIYRNRRIKLHRLQGETSSDEKAADTPCSLLYIDQLIEHEFGSERTQRMWMKDGSESNGLYPSPSIYSMLRLYLLPDIAEEHKHSLLLYMLLDYSVIYEDVRYEEVIRRLMQFPTMFGLSNTAIKATQAFWHLDHREFDFALNHLQCLTGNTLSEWQHNVVLSSLLAQKKTQAALQYLHVRKPVPMQNITKDNEGNNIINSRLSDHDKLEDWQSCCNLYLARELVYEALDVIRMGVQNANSVEDKCAILNFFYKGCRDTHQLSKILSITLSPLEEEVFIKYLETCNETQTSDILIMYFLQQARYYEAQQYNNKLKRSKQRPKDISTSIESILDGIDQENARDTLVEVSCSSLPSIANHVLRCLDDMPAQHVVAPNPMSLCVQAKSPKNTFTYKSTFIQDTIESASETWMNKPKTRRGIKRALNIEDTPFICTPRTSKTKSVFNLESDQMVAESTPSKRSKLDQRSTPRSAKVGSAIKVSEQLSKQMETLLNMPEIQSPNVTVYQDRSGAETPHSILKTRREDAFREAPSPVDSRYLGESDDERLETSSNHTHCSDATKQLRFTIPTPSELGSTPSAESPITSEERIEEDKYRPLVLKRKPEVLDEDYTTTQSHSMSESHLLESPSKKRATETITSRKSYKDTVRSRKSLSISASSLSDDLNSSIESIADIQVTLINPRYSAERRKSEITVELDKDSSVITPEKEEIKDIQKPVERIETEVMQRDEISRPRTPRMRRAIRSVSESTSVVKRRSVTPERADSPLVVPLRTSRAARSKTPEISPREPSLEPIIEQPTQEMNSEQHPQSYLLRAPRERRSRSRTPEHLEKSAKESPRLESIIESPSKESSAESPERQIARSRSQTPEETQTEQFTETKISESPRSLRSRSKTPDKIMSPKLDRTTRTKKSLSRMVLEANTFAKSKQNTENETEDENVNESLNNSIECTPKKPSSSSECFMNIVPFSPILNKSILKSPSESVVSEQSDSTNYDTKSLPSFKIETDIRKSFLNSYTSTGTVQSDSTDSFQCESPVINENFGKSILKSFENSATEGSNVSASLSMEIKETYSEITAVSRKSILKDRSSLLTSDSDIDMKDMTEDNEIDKATQKEKEQIVDIEREINEIESEMSEGSNGTSNNSNEIPDNDDSCKEILPADISDEIKKVGSSEVEESTDDVEEIISLNNGNSSTTYDSQHNHAMEIVDLKNDEETNDIVLNEDSADPLNQTGSSIMTDDNSMLENDKSDIVSSSVNVKERNLQFDASKTDVILENKVPVETCDSINAIHIVQKDTKVEQEEKNVEADEIAVVKKTRKNSTSSNMSVMDTTEKDENIPTEDSLKTEHITVQRKRSRSIASNKSIASEKEEKSVENDQEDNKTSSKKRAKTPTNSNVSKSAVRQLSEEIPLTPTRRLTRARSKSIEDNTSIDSDSSIMSCDSIISERPDRKATSVRKGRMSLLPAKPELSVIPESIVEESGKDDQRTLEDYSTSRRLTRNQKVLMESSATRLSPNETSTQPSEIRTATRVLRTPTREIHTPPRADRPRRRSSRIGSNVEDEDTSSVDTANSANRRDHEDPEETNRSSEVQESDITTSKRRTRLGRAASENKQPTPRKTVVRRVTVDIGEASESAGAGTPVTPRTPGGRRASFTRALDALHSPRRTTRRLSQDQSASRDSPSSTSRGGDTDTPTADTRKRSKKSSGK